MRNSAHAQASRRSRSLRRARAVVTAGAVAASLLVGCSGGEDEKPGRSKPPSPSRDGDGSAKEPRKKPVPFAPYVDTSLKPSYDLLEGARRTGVKEYNLAFVSPGRGKCVPMWGGRQELRENPVARQAAELRKAGGDVRVSFGGQSGNELARACKSVDDLVAAYSEVVDAYDLTKVDFDIEGPALTDTRANELRARAVARLQKRLPKLDVSFTLPVMPGGLNRDALAVLKSTEEHGTRVSSVNIMAMDYGTYYDGDMGEYAVKAATATQKQVAKVLGIRGREEAWRAVSVTPMIGVNDVKVEVFRPEDATELRKFAEKKGLGGLSMWSATRDRPCPGGPNTKAQATCSSTGDTAHEFAEAFRG
ncbi:chitinase [Streptomyces sp. WMMB 714]|uniref:chitinase n=1 Tax=Streptomyces sp. WMMB 714 TaxID=1286822 RepID=UPI000696D42D|nr:chitinase [Streptomyces sp. WMMB 714]SCK31663.1 chitinase [Streptomyces sp. WMMB 714]